MHEYSIAENLLKIIEKQCETHKIKKVKKINLKIGVLKAVIPDCLKFAFELLSKGTVLEGAKLAIKSIPLEVYCPKCGNKFNYENTFEIELCCSKCKNTDIKIKSGNEFFIDSIEGE
jgi:hydrogenase nickel incorporation protein HypA/HybF